MIRSEQQVAHFIQKGLENLLPSTSKFPFSIRINADVLAADGSLAETAVTSSAMALHSASVSTSSPLAGMLPLHCTPQLHSSSKNLPSACSVSSHSGVSVGLICDALSLPLTGSTPRCAALDAPAVVPPTQRWELVTDMQVWHASWQEHVQASALHLILRVQTSV